MKMKCKKCGADLYSNDLFCNKCGEQVKQDRKCPQCNAILRDNTVFCHQCGCRIEDTIDIPFDEIEKNILTETALEVAKENSSEYDGCEEQYGEEEFEEEYGEEEFEEEYGEEEFEEEFEEEEWEEEQERSFDLISILSIAAGAVILAIILFLAYSMYKGGNISSLLHNDKTAEETDAEDGQSLDEANLDGQVVDPADNSEAMGKITIVASVNVRNMPGTDSTILKVAKEGETYEYYGMSEDGHWFKVKLEDDTVAYIFKDYAVVQ